MDDILFLGIDNGCKGCLALINDKMKIIDILRYPRDNLKKMYDFLYKYTVKSNIKLAVIERPFLGGKHNKGNEITYEVFGTHKMNLSVLKIDYKIAEPRLNMKKCWRKEFNFKTKGRDELKIESIDMCRYLFENADKWILEPYKKNPNKFKKADDNIAESLLLAEYSHRVYLSERKK